MMYYKRNTFGGEKNMKPRIFVSSTFYDLKYIREDMSNFIKTHNFEPVMFEDGDIGYTPGKSLDNSCYETMKSADMVILIIGGNYGSPSTGEVKDEFKGYMSVTRNEFQTAVSSGIPIFAFIETSVHNEFGVYEENIDNIENKKVGIRFKSVKDINVFRFILEIKTIGTIVMTEFRKPSEIKDFMARQWSDMLKKYLDGLKQGNEYINLKDSILSLQAMIRQTNSLISELKVDDDTRNEVEKKERLFDFCNIVANTFLFRYQDTISYSQRHSLIDALLKSILQILEQKLPDQYKELEYESSLKGKYISETFDIFHNNNLVLGSISGIWYEQMAGWSDMLKSGDNVALIREMLISDEYYLRLFKNSIGDIIPQKE